MLSASNVLAWLTCSSSIPMNASSSSLQDSEDASYPPTTQTLISLHLETLLSDSWFGLICIPPFLGQFSSWLFLSLALVSLFLFSRVPYDHPLDSFRLCHINESSQSFCSHFVLTCLCCLTYHWIKISIASASISSRKTSGSAWGRYRFTVIRHSC